MGDVNDNSPVFSQSVYNITVREDITNVPAAIGQVEATDADLDLNAKVTYIIVDGNIGKYVLYHLMP